MESNVLSQASLAVLLLEGFKYLVRLVMKNPTYEFPTKFYVVGLAAMQVVAVLVLAVLGVAGYVLPSDWIGWVRDFVIVILGSLVSVTVYSAGFKPAKAYVMARLRPTVLEPAKKAKKVK